MFGISLATVFAWIIGGGAPFIAVALIVLAILAYFYVPAIGKGLAIALVAVSAGLFAYGAGFKDRGELDKSAQLQAQIEVLKSNVAEMQRQAHASAEIAEESGAAEVLAVNNAEANQQKVAQYETDLAKRPATCRNFADVDVGGLLRIGSTGRPTNPPQPPARPFDVRPLSQRSGSP